MIPKIVTSADPGAPQLTGEDSRLPAVLDFALRDSPNALGWTTPFTNTTSKGVWRNNQTTGSGGYLRVLDTDADHASDARMAAVEAYTSMSDIDTGTDKTPDTGEKYFFKSKSADATARDWIIVGTDKFFWYMPFAGPDTGNNRGYLIYYCGDPAATYSNDPFPFVLGGTTTPTVGPTTNIGGLMQVTSTNPGGTSQLAKTWVKDFSAVSGSIDCGHQIHPSGMSTTFGIPGSVAMQTWPNTPNAITVSKIAMLEMTAITTARFHRGYLPGILCPLVNIQLANQSTWQDGDQVPGINNGLGIVQATYRPMVTAPNFNSPSVTGAVLFDTATDWDDW